MKSRQSKVPGQLQPAADQVIQSQSSVGMKGVQPHPFFYVCFLLLFIPVLVHFGVCVAFLHQGGAFRQQRIMLAWFVLVYRQVYTFHPLFQE